MVVHVVMTISFIALWAVTLGGSYTLAARFSRGEATAPGEIVLGSMGWAALIVLWFN